LDKNLVAFGHLGKWGLFVVEVGGVVPSLDVCPQKSGESNGPATCTEQDRPFIERSGADPHRHRESLGVRHLRGDGALPDQFVQSRLVGSHFLGKLLRRCKGLSGGANRFVSLLGPLDLGGVNTWFGAQIFFTVQLGYLAARCGDGRSGK
jgi:hypothetical protein